MFVTILCLTLVHVISADSTKLLEPPSITQGPPASVKYLADLPDAEVDLHCKSTGSDRLEYEWLSNGRQIQDANKDVYTLKRDESASDGYYQCRVHNSLGRAVSNVTRLLKAKQAVFSQQDYAKPYHATLGDKLKIECKWLQRGIPTPDPESFSWKYKTDKRQFTTNRRIQMDEMGNMYISAVEESDIGKEILCHVHKEVNKVSVAGSQSLIENTGDPEVNPRKPSIMFFSNQSANYDGPMTNQTTVVAVEGQTVSLRCFFSGNDDIQIEWRQDGSTPSIKYTKTQKFGSELLIMDVQPSDRAVLFECIGSSSIGHTTFTTIMHVVAVPKFLSQEDQPHNKNVSVGDDVTFSCKTNARPTANVIWFINGNDFGTEASKRPNKLRLSEDKTTLTVKKVCKDSCVGAPSDIMVVQCNASNQYGSVFANGYINVFQRTVFTMEPEDVKDVALGTNITFSARAESDPSTPVTYSWYHDGHRLKNDNNKYLVDESAGGLTIAGAEESDAGNYKCVASNGVSEVEKTVSAVFIVIETSQSSMWILFVLLPLIFLLFVAIVLFIACTVHRNRGEDYLVDEAERKCGNDPEKVLADAELQPFSRQDDVSTHSLGRSDTGSTRNLINEDFSTPTTVDTIRRPSDFGTLK